MPRLAKIDYNFSIPWSVWVQKDGGAESHVGLIKSNYRAASKALIVNRNPDQGAKSDDRLGVCNRNK